MVFKNFFIDERKAERWLMLCSRCLIFCRARFLAWGELAKRHPLEFDLVIGVRNIPDFLFIVKSNKSFMSVFILCPQK